MLISVPILHRTHVPDRYSLKKEKKRKRTERQNEKQTVQLNIEHMSIYKEKIEQNSRLYTNAEEHKLVKYEFQIKTHEK